MSTPHNVFRVETEGDTLIVVPQGDASGFRYNDVHIETNASLRLLDNPALKNLVVDLGSVQVLGSIIITSIIKLARKAQNVGGGAAFCNASQPMLEVLETMNFGRLWPYFPTREEAIRSFEQ